MSAHVDVAALASAAGASRRAMLAHLGQCASCRRDAVAHDPAILFSLLALAPMPESTLQDLSLSVARLAGRDRSPSGVFMGLATWPRVAASAAAVVLVLACGYEMLRERPAAAPVFSMSRPRADVDVESGRGVSQVIDLTVGETQIVMVYNGDLKL